MILLSVNFMRGKLRRAIIFDAAPLMHLLRCSFVKGDYARPTASMTTREKFHLSNTPWQYIASLILLAYIMQTNKQPSGICRHQPEYLWTRTSSVRIYSFLHNFKQVTNRSASKRSGWWLKELPNGNMSNCQSVDKTCQSTRFSMLLRLDVIQFFTHLRAQVTWYPCMKMVFI